MLLHIIKKEILQGVISLRFPLMLILITTAMGSAAFLFLEDYQQQVADYDANVKSDLHKLAQRAKPHPFALAFVFSRNHQWVYRAPTRLAFIAEGHEKYLPNAFQVNAFTMNGPTKKLRDNYFLRWSEDLDWVFIVSMLMSFFAIVLVYDSISGEREGGTLKLLMSNSVPRSTVIMAKYVSIMIILIATLLVGMLFSMIIITSSGKIQLMSADWVRIAITGAFSILYLSIFVILGLFISSSLRSSAAVLVILLLLWTLMVVVVPGIGGTITTSLSMTHEKDTSPNPYAILNQARQDYIERHPEGTRWMGGTWDPRDSLGKHIYSYNAFMRVVNTTHDGMVRQVRLGRNVTRISPSVVYRRAVEAIAGSGIDHYESFMKQTQRYRLALQDCLISHHPADIHKQYSGGEATKLFSNLDFTEADVPRFQDEPILMVESLGASLWDMTILLLLNVVLFMAAHISFLKRDVR
ncbi:ABC transporter permease subunit [Candidatus Poribacteria bacterium]